MCFQQAGAWAEPWGSAMTAACSPVRVVAFTARPPGVIAFQASTAGEHTGDDPKEFLADLRRKVESRIAQWQSMGPKAPIAALVPVSGPMAPQIPVSPLNSIDLDNEEEPRE